MFAISSPDEFLVPLVTPKHTRLCTATLQR